MPRSFAAALAAALFVTSPAAFALAQRTFVSTAGNDANTASNCSLVAPCRSFGSALSVTQTDGEIVVQDSGGYGRVTIDKSVAIVAPAGVYAGISVFAGTNGVDVDGAGIAVALRGLMINGQGGDHGIVFTQGSRLYIEQCTISNMGLRGVYLLTGDAFITDTTIRDNGSFGIYAEGSVDVTVDRTRIERNNNSGVRLLNGPRFTMTNSVVSGNFGAGGIDVDTNDGATETLISVAESTISQNATTGFTAASTGAGSKVRVALTRNVLARNGSTAVVLNAVTGTLAGVVSDNLIARNIGSGVVAAGTGVSMTVAANAITGNSFGLDQLGSATLKTRSNNVVQDNATDVNGVLTFVAGD